MFHSSMASIGGAGLDRVQFASFVIFKSDRLIIPLIFGGMDHSVVAGYIAGKGLSFEDSSGGRVAGICLLGFENSIPLLLWKKEVPFCP